MFKTDIGPYELHSVLSLPIVGEIMASLQDYNISPPVRTELETVLENWYYGLPEGRERYRQCNLALHYNLTSLFKISQSFIFHGGFSGCVRVAFEPLQLVLDVFQRVCSAWSCSCHFLGKFSQSGRGFAFRGGLDSEVAWDECTFLQVMHCLWCAVVYSWATVEKHFFPGCVCKRSSFSLSIRLMVE